MPLTPPPRPRMASVLRAALNCPHGSSGTPQPGPPSSCASLCSHELPVVVPLLPVAPRSPHPDSVPRPLHFHPCSGWSLCRGALTIPPPWHPRLPTCPTAPKVAFETTVQAPVNCEVQTEEAPFAFSAEGLPHLPAPSRL